MPASASITSVRPAWSATIPRPAADGTAEAEGEAQHDARRRPGAARQHALGQHDRDPEVGVEREADRSTEPERGHLAGDREQGDQREERGHAADDDGAGAVSVGQAPADQRAGGPRREEQRERRVPGSRRHVQVADEPDRDERQEAVPHGGAGDDHGREHRERAPVVVGGRAPGRRGGPRRRRGGNEPRTDRPEQERGERRDDRDEERSSQPERRHPGRHDDGADDEARVPSDRVEAHARRRPRAGHERDVARPLGMEGRDTDASDDDGAERRGIAAGDPDEGDADAADEHARGHEPGALHSIRGVAEQRLDDRRADGQREQERRRAGVGEPAVRDQKRQERGNGALAEVARHVPGGDRRERAPVSADGRGECVGIGRHVAPRYRTGCG